MLRRLFRAALLLTMLLCLLPAARCEEASGLKITAEASPDSMVLAQEAEFSILLENTGSALLRSVFVLFPEANGQHPVGDIAAGTAAAVEFSYPVTDADLTAGGVTFSVTCSDADGAGLPPVDVTVPLTREAERPEVEFTRQLSSRYVHAGEEATIVYQVKNTGNVPLTALEIADPLGAFTDALERLEAGATHTFISRVSVDAPAASTPTLRFSSGASGQSYTKSLTSAPVEPAEENISVDLSVDRAQAAYGESVVLTLTLTNSGNVSYSDITLSDGVLGMLANEPLSLPSGAEPLTITRSCVIKADSTFKVHVSGKTNAGAAFAADTAPVTVTVLKGETDEGLTLTAVPSARTLSEPGMVSFTLTLTNNGQSDLSRVTLREAERGEIRLFDVVPAGAPTVREQMYDVSGDSAFRFIAEFTGEDGSTRIVSSDEIHISLSEDGLSPMATPAAGFGALLHSTAFRVGNVSVYPIMIAGALLLLIILVMALVVTGRKKRRQREANRAERQKRSELLGKTNPFTPVSKNKDGKRR